MSNVEEVLGVPSRQEASEAPPLTERETSSLLRRNQNQQQRDESYEVLVSNELLRIAEDGGGAARYNYTYNGRRVKPMLVSSKSYTR